MLDQRFSPCLLGLSAKPKGTSERDAIASHHPDPPDFKREAIALRGGEEARKCYRQKRMASFIFFGEQFWGRAARASWTRKSFVTPVIFLVIIFLIIARLAVPNIHS
jgi:hypothetical protein